MHGANMKTGFLNSHWQLIAELSTLRVSKPSQRC